MSTTSTRLALQALHNTRDLGGIPTQSGRRILPKKLLRSGALADATQSDLDALLGEYRLQEIIDLRTPTEIAQRPDPVLPGVHVHEFSMLRSQHLGTTFEKSARPMSATEQMLEFARQIGEHPERMNEQLYPQLMSDENAIAAMRNFFGVLLTPREGAVLWHCTAGKDRVGCATATLLLALGVSREDIMADFLFTNDCVREMTQKMLTQAKEETDDPVLLHGIEVLNGVQASYLQGVFDRIDNDFGGSDAYLKNVVQLDDKKRAALAALYLEA